jgi:hypothetical protein
MGVWDGQQFLKHGFEHRPVSTRSQPRGRLNVFFWRIAASSRSTVEGGQSGGFLPTPRIHWLAADWPSAC